MSIEAITIALHHAEGLNSTERLVLIGVANHYGEGGCWPTLGTLGKYAGVSDRNVRKALKKLQEVGYLRVDVNGGPGARADQRPNLYHFLLRCPVDCDRSMSHRSGGSDASSRTERGVGEGSNGGSEATERGVGGDLLTVNQPSVQPSLTDAPADAFAYWWDLYPKKVGKTDAERKYKAAVKNGATTAQLLDGLTAAVAMWTTSGTEKRFIPNPATWLNQGRWEDEYGPAQGSKADRLLKAGWEPIGGGLYRKGEFIVDENGKGQN